MAIAAVLDVQNFSLYIVLLEFNGPEGMGAIAGAVKK